MSTGDNICERCGHWRVLCKCPDFTAFKYECPTCGGKFNYRIIKFDEGTSVATHYHCPFCGRSMLGF